MPDDPSTAANSGIRNRGYRWYLEITARLVGGGTVGWFAASRIVSAPGAASAFLVSVLWALALFLLAFTADTAVHELGHLAASRLVGFRFALITVFPLSLSRGPRGWKVGRGRSMGQCLAYPTDTRNLRRRTLVYFSGGALGGFTCTTIAAVILGFGLVSPGKLADFLAWWFWIGLVFNTLSLMPLSEDTDGFCLNVLRRPGPQADQFIAVFTTQILEMVGVRYRDVDRLLGDALTQPSCTSEWRLIGQNAAYFIALDSGRLDTARTLLDGLSEIAAETPSRPDVALELAYFFAAHEQNAAEARRHLDAAEGQSSPFARVLAEAAIRLEEGQPAAALAVLDPARPESLAIAREGTGMGQLVTDRFVTLSARAGGGSSGSGLVGQAAVGIR